jgi:hypothetical protein
MFSKTKNQIEMIKLWPTMVGWGHNKGNFYMGLYRKIFKKSSQEALSQKSLNSQSWKMSDLAQIQLTYKKPMPPGGRDRPVLGKQFKHMVI